MASSYGTAARQVLTCCLLVALAAGSCRACRKENYDLDRIGDLPAGRFRVATETACMSKCLERLVCRAVTWWQDAPDSAPANCFLKAPPAGAVPAPRQGFTMVYVSPTACGSVPLPAPDSPPAPAPTLAEDSSVAGDIAARVPEPEPVPVEDPSVTGDESPPPPPPLPYVTTQWCNAMRQCGNGELCNIGTSLCEEEVINPAGAVPMMAPGDRIAYSSDGNKRDEDDVGATPMSLALLDAAGEKNKLVYFGYANHIWEQHEDGNKVFDIDGTPTSQDDLMRLTVNESVRVYGYNPDLFFDEYTEFVQSGGLSDGNRAIDAFAAAVLATTPDSALWVIGAGPMETIYQGLQAAIRTGGCAPRCLENVNIVSHSVANNQHGSTYQETTHNGQRYRSTWGDLKKLVADQGGKVYYGGPECTAGYCDRLPNERLPVDSPYPRDQNSGLDWEGIDPNALRGPSSKNWAPWYWMRDSSDERVQWLWTSLERSVVPDPSDAGMIYWLLTSDDLTTPRKLEAYFGLKYSTPSA